MKKILLLLTLVLTMLTGLAAAAAPTTPPADNSPKMLVSYGEIEQLNKDGFLFKPQGEAMKIYMRFAGTKYLFDGTNGKILTRSALQNGQKAMVYYSPMMTRSIPPQTNLHAVVVGEDGNMPRFMQVEEIRINAQGIKIMDTRKDLIVTIPKNQFKGMEYGTHLLVWHGPVALSMPGQTTAYKVINVDKKMK